MPLREKRIDFESECERLQEQMEEVAEQQVELKKKGKPEKAEQVLIQGNELNNQKNILQALMDGGVEGVEPMDSILLAGLTAGEVNRVEDTVEDDVSLRERDAWVAIGTIEGPYVHHDPGNVKQKEYEASCHAVTDLPLPYVRWAEGRISELSHLAQEAGNGYIELVQAKQDT